MTPRLTLPVEVTVPTQGHARRSIRLHHAPAIDTDRAQHEGLPVTTVPRTLLDLASSQPRRPLEQALDRTERLGLLDLPAIDAGFELDMYWEQERFAVELDGYEHHRTRAAFERDRLRQEELKLAGIEMIRLTSKRIAYEPEIVVQRLAMLLERRSGELGDSRGSAG